jgi:hypothetical protein
MNKGAKIGIVIALFVLLGVGGYYGYKALYKPKDEDEDETIIIPPTNSGNGSGSGSTSPTAPSELDTKAKITDFQNYVINTKKDTAILGSSGADGLWGKNSQKAWDKYSADYKKKGTGSGNTNVKANTNEIVTIQGFATGDKTSDAYLKSTNQEFVKKWAERIKGKKSAFIFANQVYRTKTGDKILEYNPTTTNLYAKKDEYILKSEPNKSASASYVQKNTNLGKGGDVAFADGYLYIWLKGKEKWVASIWVSPKKVSFNGEDEFEQFNGFTNDND